MPGSRCSKSDSFSTCRVPPFLPPVSDCVDGLWYPPVPTLSLPELLDLLEPHAAMTTASATTTAAAAIALIDLIASPPVRVSPVPRRVDVSRHQALLGLSASRNPSPSRLKASTVSNNAAPGKTMYHQAVVKIGVALEIICPQLAVGGRIPTPR